VRTLQSPLFEPVVWTGDGFKVLNEIVLPETVEYIEIADVAQAIDAVREMKTRAFGQVLVFFYSGALLAERYAGTEAARLREELANITGRFSEARPTFDFKILNEFFVNWFDELPGSVSIGAWISERARGFAGEIIKARLARAKRAATVLPNRARVMTHCNVSGELVAVAHFCKEMGKEISVVATETRPYLQGSRLTAWELSQAGVSVSVIPDCAIAQVMARGEISAVIVGADRCAQNGDVINKVGTYPLAMMAKDYGVPFVALVQDPGSLTDGAAVSIEERPISELLEFQGRPLVSENSDKLAGRYPAFDVTPASLITYLIGFDDLYTAETFQNKFLKGAASSARDAKISSGKYLLVFGVPRQDSYDFLSHALKAEQAERVLVPEMRPNLFGSRIVARELLCRDVPTTLISDNMMGALFAQQEIRKLYLFYNGLSETGVEGICGSLLAARLAHAHGVPIELQESQNSQECSPDQDVSTFLGQKILPDGASVYPIEKEFVAWSLLKNDHGANR